MSESLAVINEKPWYGEGLKFKCTGCGQCCTGGPGHVWVSTTEIETMSRHLGINPNEFGLLYLRKIGNRYSLIERKNFDCIFLKNKQCQIYPVRPKQCRTFPWWTSNLQSRHDWNEAGKTCEGINHPDGEWFAFAEIEKQRILEEKG